MKLLVLSLFVCATATVKAIDQKILNEMKQKVQQLAVECIDDVHASDADVEELMSHHIPATHEGQCVIFCVNKKLNWMHEEGTFNKEGVYKNMEVLKEDAELYGKLEKILEICTEKTKIESDPCVTAANYASCGLKEGKALGLTAENLGL